MYQAHLLVSYYNHIRGMAQLKFRDLNVVATISTGKVARALLEDGLGRRRRPAGRLVLVYRAVWMEQLANGS
jgi:hypothetical protein